MTAGRKLVSTECGNHVDTEICVFQRHTKQGNRAKIEIFLLLKEKKNPKHFNILQTFVLRAFKDARMVQLLTPLSLTM